jgi:hypothetical protein
MKIYMQDLKQSIQLLNTVLCYEHPSWIRPHVFCKECGAALIRRWTLINIQNVLGVLEQTLIDHKWTSAECGSFH